MRSAICIAVLLFFARAAIPGTLHVPGQYPTIQQAIDAAMNGDLILVAPGTYVENIDFFGKVITVRSDLDGNPATQDLATDTTIIDGNRWGSVVTFRDQETRDSVIAGFTITNGSGTEFGAASKYGGGILIMKPSSPTVRQNIITYNLVVAHEGLGGGIYCSGYSNPRIEGNRITMNGVTRDGGGIYGGMFAGTEIRNNLIYKNGAYDSGGGVFLRGSDPLDAGGTGSYDHKLTNNTIHGNWAGEFGGGIFSFTSYSLIQNCILWDNEAPLLPEIGTFFIDPDVFYCDIKGGYGSGSSMHIIDQDPLFMDPLNGDFHLDWRSPCINRGTNAEAPPKDFDDDPRPYMGTVDMGADEFIGVHALEADVFALSESSGGQIHFSLNGGSGNGNRTYITLGTLKGTIPGQKLPGGDSILPLNWDLFTDVVIAFMNTGFFKDFMSQLANDGSGSAVFDTLGPMPPGLVGVFFSFTYAVQSPGWGFVSNPVSVEILP